MKDIVFYPLIALIIGAIIAFALTRGDAVARVTPETIRQSGFTVAGDDLVHLTASPGTEIIVSDSAARALAVQGQRSAPPSAGIFATLIPIHEKVFGGEELEIIWRVRRPDGPGPVQIGYFTIGAGDSGWQMRTVGPEWEDIRFAFTPGVPTGEGYDYVGLWPGGPEEANIIVEIESVRVRLLR